MDTVILSKNSLEILWYLLITIGGLAAIINIIRFINQTTVSEVEQYENIIKEKNKIIESLENKVFKYQEILKDNSHDDRTDKLE